MKCWNVGSPQAYLKMVSISNQFVNRRRQSFAIVLDLEKKKCLLSKRDTDAPEARSDLGIRFYAGAQVSGAISISTRRF